jgi:hypothetical protein
MLNVLTVRKFYFGISWKFYTGYFTSDNEPDGIENTFPIVITIVGLSFEKFFYQ